MLSGRLARHMFDKPCFGLMYDVEAGEASNIYLGLKGNSYELNKYPERFDLLKIALFDLWLANNDRNHNNYNLLLKDGRFVPIDHSEIFDGSSLGRKLSQLTVD